MIWISHPTEIPAAILKDRQKEQDQSRYMPTLPQWPRGEITSLLGNRHEVTIEKGMGGWRVIRDAYEEASLYGASPDGSLQIPPPPQSTSDSTLSPMTITSYNRSGAVSYATSRCTSYNSSYCNYNASYCGGDCANFVSQCFYAGGQAKDSNWKTYSGPCGGSQCAAYAGSSPNAATYEWANNKGLRDWFIGHRGAVAQPNISYLGAGDIVNYITGTNTDWNHVTIVVQAQAGTSGALICSHNPDRCSTSWSLSDFSPKNYSYTRIN